MNKHVSPFVKRSRIQIIFEILSVSQKDVLKTRILYKCNLSYEQLKKYLNYLLSRDLLSVSEEGRKKYFHITAKGKEFLSGYKQIKLTE
jgi:predicted transcriptional regulator